MRDINSDEQKQRETDLEVLFEGSGYIAVEIQVDEDGEGAQARLSTNLSNDVVSDVLFGILSQLN